MILRHCSRSRKLADELPISQNRHLAKIERAPLDLCFLGTSALVRGLYWDEGLGLRFGWARVRLGFRVGGCS